MADTDDVATSFQTHPRRAFLVALLSSSQRAVFVCVVHMTSLEFLLFFPLVLVFFIVCTFSATFGVIQWSQSLSSFCFLFDGFYSLCLCLCPLSTLG